MKSIKIKGRSAGKRVEVFMLTCALDEALASEQSPVDMIPGERANLAAFLAKYVVIRRRSKKAGAKEP